MRRHSFFLKLFLGNLLLVALIVGVGGGMSYRALNAEFRQAHAQQQDKIAQVAAGAFGPIWPAAPDAEQAARLDDQAKRLFADMPSLRLTLIGTDGQVIADSLADPRTMANHLGPSRPEVERAMAGAPAWDIRGSQTLGTSFRYLALPVERDGEPLGVLRVAMPVGAIAESGRFIGAALLWSGLAAALAAVALALLVSWVWYAPLRQITRTAGEIAAGDLDARADISGSDELAQLGQALNEMRRRLAAHIQTIAAQRENLQTVVANLQEGVVAVDGDGRIVLMNPAAQRLMASGEDVLGRHLQDVIRAAKVVDVWQEAAAGGPVERQIDTDIRGRQRVLAVHASTVAAEEHNAINCLLVIRDVTDAAQAAAMKAEFVANASHELRTPLATLRAAVEALSMSEPDDDQARTKLADMLERNVARLEALTNDLLDLHKVETTGYRLHYERLDMEQLVGWARGEFADRLAQRELVLDTVVDPPGGSFRSDPVLVQLILQNLLDNAVKFTEPGERVQLRVAVRESSATLEVTDSGCGIPAALQSRVFERFFQVDPARSGDARTRGTGLGLAIVKHAADRLGAAVDVQSRPGDGSTFTVHLPA